MTLRQWLEAAPFTLSLSAGFFGFYSHCGFTKALWEQGLRPKALSGASAGALISSLISSGMTPDQIENVIRTTRKSDFWDLKLGMGLLAGLKFEKLLKQYLPENFDNLKIPLKISTFHLLQRKTVTFHQGTDLASAVRASCCFPFLFHPVKIQGDRYIDGGVADWLALNSIPAQERVLIHYLEPDGFMNDRMKKRIRFQVKSESHKLLVLDERFPMGPNRMHLADEAIEKSYRQTLSLLDQPFK